MPKYIIERNMPGAGNVPPEGHKGGARNSLKVLEEMGAGIQWVESFVTEDKVYCVYIAPDKEAIREHSEKAGIPVDRISEVSCVIDPTTAEG
jgi:hypothetical protein